MDREPCPCYVAGPERAGGCHSSPTGCRTMCSGQRRPQRGPITGSQWRGVDLDRWWLRPPNAKAIRQCTSAVNLGPNAITSRSFLPGGGWHTNQRGELEAAAAACVIAASLGLRLRLRSDSEWVLTSLDRLKEQPVWHSRCRRCRPSYGSSGRTWASMQSWSTSQRTRPSKE